jgi:hypothetical protein
MQYAKMVLVLACFITPFLGQEAGEGPTNEKAQKTYREALEYARKHMTEAALDGFKKADEQDGGHCLPCQQKMVKYGVELGDWKTAETAAVEMVAEAQGEKNVALAHYQRRGFTSTRTNSSLVPTRSSLRASIEGKLKKLVGRARDMQVPEKQRQE